MGAPSLPHFQLQPTFFGFSPQDRVRNHENIFSLIWFGEGRWTWQDIYHMPIFLRSFWIQRCNEIQDNRIEIQKKLERQRKSKQQSLPTKPKR